MEPGTVLLLGDTHLASEVGAFANGDLPVVVVSPATSDAHAEVPRLCAEIARLDPPGPLVIVAFGHTAAFLPRVALAQRASHRRISEYVLVVPVLPDVTDSWPDAPVTIYCPPDDAVADLARLRGWPHFPTEQLASWRPAE